MHYACVPSTFWNFAVQLAAYIHNRALTKSIPDNKTPFEIWFGRPISNENFWMYCLQCNPQNTTPNKLTDRAIKCVFLGYSQTSSGYILYDIESNFTFESRDDRFKEDEFPFQGLSSSDPLIDLETDDPNDETYSQ